MAAGRVKLVFDENFSHRQVGFISRESGLGEIQHTRPMSWSGLHDSVWYPLAIKADFVIISGDRNEKTRQYTVEDLKEMGARLLMLGPFWDHLSGWDRAKWLVNSIDSIHATASTMTPGTAMLLDRRGRSREL